MAELNITPAGDLIHMALSVEPVRLDELLSKCLSDIERNILVWIHRWWATGGMVSDELFINCMEFMASLGWQLTPREFELYTWLGAMTDAE